MLKRKGKSLQDVVNVLKLFRDNVDDDESEAALAEDASPPQREILTGLINFLEACR